MVVIVLCGITQDTIISLYSSCRSILRGCWLHKVIARLDLVYSLYVVGVRSLISHLSKGCKTMLLVSVAA